MVSSNQLIVVLVLPSLMAAIAFTTQKLLESKIKVLAQTQQPVYNRNRGATVKTEKQKPPALHQ